MKFAEIPDSSGETSAPVLGQGIKRGIAFPGRPDYRRLVIAAKWFDRPLKAARTKHHARSL
jgi:hypothetical protein